MSNKPITVEEAADAYGLDIKSNSYNFSSERILAEEAFKAGAQWKEQQMEEEKLEEERRTTLSWLRELKRCLFNAPERQYEMSIIDDLITKYNSK